jgi:hypothetical protein
MKRMYAITLLLFALCGLARAQCLSSPKAAPSSKAWENQWQKVEDRIFGHIRGSRLARMKNTSAGIISLLRDSILTEGSLNPVWHGEYFSAANGGPQVRFGVSCVFHNGDANSNLDNDLTVFANDISPLMGRLTVNGHVFVTLKGIIGGKGRPAFEFDLPSGDNTGAAAPETIHVKAWLVTADSSMLPYIPVTRREYLEQARQELGIRKEAVIADIHGRIRIRSAAEQEAGQQQMLEQLRSTYSGTELQTRIRICLGNYKTDEDYVAHAIAVATEELNHTIGLIDGLLTGSTAQQLAQPAIVSVPCTAFHGFEDDGPDRTVLVRLRASYYTGDADQATIKSLLICWRYHPADPTAAGIDHQLAGNFERGRLKDLFEK